ncbi:MAG TPA: GNAT family protein [Clostridia bacterium]|nr:GNAT family protein [Clostridia bacterium]
MSEIKFVFIETERLILRKFREADAETFFKYRTDPRVARYQGDIWANYRFEQALEFVRGQMNAEPGIPDSWFQIAVESKSEACLIGDLAIHTLQHETDQAEIGFTLDPAYRNKGFGTEAVKHLLGYIFHVLKLRRVIAITDVRNEDSIRLLERIGMRREGHFIKSVWNKGEYVDEYLYALLSEECV